MGWKVTHEKKLEVSDGLGDHLTLKEIEEMGNSEFHALWNIITQANTVVRLMKECFNLLEKEGAR